MGGVATCEGNNIVVFYYLSASGIWLDKKYDLWLEGPHKKVTTVHNK